MRVWFRPPGVYPVQADTTLMVQALRQVDLPDRARVLDAGTGTGVIAVAAALAGDYAVTAVDLSRRAVVAARLNSFLHRAAVHVERGDAIRYLAHRTFDVIVSNPPYVPSACAPRNRHTVNRSWDAGPDGRAHLDRLCTEGAEALTPGGTILIVHSAICGVRTSLSQLRQRGLKAHVLARRVEPFGPVMRQRAELFEELGLIEVGQRHEELVVINGHRPYERDERSTPAAKQFTGAPTSHNCP